MDTVTLMNAMKTVSENLTVPTDSSDEFSKALDDLIQKATAISNSIEERKASQRQKRLMNASDDDVKCTTEIETINVESDSSGSIDSSFQLTVASTPSTSPSLSYKRIVQPEVKLKRLNTNDVSIALLKKQCSVKLHRMDVTALLRIHGLDQDVVAVSGDIDVASLLKIPKHEATKNKAYIMDTVTLMNAMKTVSENLTVPTDSSDEFSKALDDLIQKATAISNSIEERKASQRQKRLMNASDDDVRCTTEIETINVESDSSGSIDSSFQLAVASTPSTSPSLSYKRIVKPEVKLKRLNTNDVSIALLKKQCSVKLHRMDVTALLRIHGLDQDVVAVSGDIDVASLSKIPKHEATKNKVSLSESTSNNDSKPLGQYTYEDYEKRYRDVCSMQ